MNEEALINLVRDHRELYDPDYKYYEDQPRREAAWQEIADKLQQSAHECKDRWKRLRDNYRRARKLRLRKKAEGCKKIKAIKFEKALCFMDSIIDSRPNREKEDPDDEDSGSEREEIDVPLVPIVTDNSYAEPVRTQTQTHPLTTFFANVGQTVKTFPEEMQIRVKRDIFKIINDAEEEVYFKRLRRS